MKKLSGTSSPKPPEVTFFTDRDLGKGMTDRGKMADLANDLVLGLDGPPDSQAAQEWDAELLRRMDEIEAGTAPLIDRSEFQRRMRERLAAELRKRLDA